jgi:hypothetical protein
MKRYSIFAILSVLLFAAMACSLFGGSGAPAAPGSEGASAGGSQGDNLSDDRLRNEEGGFSFRNISGYQADTFYNFISIETEDADPELGPMILLVGDVGKEKAALSDVFDQFVDEYGSQSDFLVSDRREVTVAGLPGYAADFLGETPSGTAIGGRITLVVVSEDQQFTMFGFAQIDRWKNEFAPLYEEVLSSVEFFEPQ